jgi:ribosomal protein S18 acetylase RimI-like enzyme
MFLYEEGSQLLCVGELRRDDQQPGIAHLGIVVSEEARGQGIGSRMMTSLVGRSRDEGLAPHCSTEVTNVGARRAIERAGFRATHRLLFLTA